MSSHPTPEQAWFARYNAAAGKPRADPQWTAIHHDLLQIRANHPTLGYAPARPNPWHREPADPAVIGEGAAEQLDKLGKILRIGPYPRPKLPQR